MENTGKKLTDKQKIDYMFGLIKRLSLRVKDLEDFVDKNPQLGKKININAEPSVTDSDVLESQPLRNLSIEVATSLPVLTHQQTLNFDMELAKLVKKYSIVSLEVKPIGQ